MNRRALSVCTIVCPFEPNDSESRLFLGSAWVHRVFVSISLARGIPCEVMRTEPYHLCGVRYDGLEGVKL